MKFTLGFVAMSMVVAFAYSFPSSGDWTQAELNDGAILWEEQPESAPRLKRATCDLFSFQSKWVTPNHAACAAHCILRGNRGGNCQGTICHCRK